MSGGETYSAAATIERSAVEDGMRGRAASDEHCRTAVPFPSYTVSQPVTLPVSLKPVP